MERDRAVPVVEVGGVDDLSQDDPAGLTDLPGEDVELAGLRLGPNPVTARIDRRYSDPSLGQESMTARRTLASSCPPLDRSASWLVSLTVEEV